jgi:hypothetical protein
MRDILVALALSIPVSASDCVTAVTPDVSLLYIGGIATVPVVAPGGCTWSISNVPDWISGSPSSGSGTGLVMLTVAPHLSSQARVAYIAIGGQIVRIAQSGAFGYNCFFVLDTVRVIAGADGELATVGITGVPPACPWLNSSGAPWAQVYPLTGNGPSPVQVRVFPNFGSVVRTTDVSIASRAVSIAQSGATGTVTDRFVRMLYYEFLGRFPAMPELGFQSAQLTNGVLRSELAERFFVSEEFNIAGRFIAGAYIGLLGREPEFSGWLFQRAAMIEGAIDQRALVSNFLNSAEYRQVFGFPSDREFMRLLYQRILFREPSEDEIQFHVVNVVLPRGRVQAAMNLLNSAEFRLNTAVRVNVLLIFFSVAGRGPSQTEFLQGQQIVQTQGVRALIAALLQGSGFGD